MAECWFGNVPEGWRITRAKNVFTQRMTKGNEENLVLLAATQKYGMIPQHEVDGVVQVKADTDLSTFRTVKKNDFVISLRSFQGGFEISAYEGVCSPAYQVFYATQPIYHGYYRYFFKSDVFIQEMNSLTVGIREGKNIQYSFFATTEIPVPPIQEQEAIAAYLDEQCTLIDEAVAEAKASVEELQIWRTSIITKAVTSGVGKKANVKDSGVLWIGKIPSEWSVVKAARIIRSTQNGITRRDLEKSQGTIVLKLKNITPEGNIIYDDANRIDLSPSELESYKLIPNDILFVRVNGSRTLVGKCALFCGAPEDIAYNDHIIRVRLDNHMCLTEYFKWYMLSDSGKREIELHTSTAAGQYTISGIGLRNIVLTLPSISEQHQICNYLHEKMEEVERLASEKKALISDLESYKRSLIYETVTGKRKVVQ